MGDSTDLAAVPTVSVVMTVYNTRRYLADAVRSILAQTLADFEFIVIDDGSTDGSTDLLREFERSDNRIRIISRPNTGIVKAANEGIALARGEFVARMDSDDIALPHRFEKQVEYLREHPEYVAVGSRVWLMDPYGVPFAQSEHALTHQEIDAQLLTCAGGFAIMQPTAMIRTQALRKIGGYRGAQNVSEDHDLFVRLAEVGRVANIAEPLLHYRRHYKSVSHTQYEQQKETKQRILSETYQRRGLTPPAKWDLVFWRPPPLREQLRQWGWAALKQGKLKIARRHAANAVWRAPLSGSAWRLLFCAVRGH